MNVGELSSKTGKLKASASALSEEKETVLWPEKVAVEVIKRKRKEFVVEGMWTPSGFFHIGNARPEVFTPFAVKRALEDKGFKVRQNFIIDDFDAVRKIPEGLGVKKEEEGRYLGFPIAIAPSPLPGFKTWAEAFVSQLKKHASSFGVGLNFISAFETYKNGDFNDLIKFSIEHSAEIARVWKQVSGAEKSEEFVPLQVVCQSCKKIYYTKILSFDGKQVEYECSCGFKGKTSPFNGNAKLHWRVHWVAHWILHKVDFESGGKDHFSKGGSVDVGRALMQEVFKKEPPVQVPTEFIQLSGEKMSGSKGNVIDLEQWLEVASPELFRYLIFSYKPNSVIEFSFKDNSFILLNERFERAERIFYNLEKAENAKMERKLKKSFEFSIIGKPAKRMIQLPFSTAVSLSQLFNLEKDFEPCLKKIFEICKIPQKLSKAEKEKIMEKLQKAKNWVEKHAPEDSKIKFLEEFNPALLSNLSKETIKAINDIAKKLEKLKTPEQIQKLIFDCAKSNNASSKEVFQAIYLSLLGKKQGPKAGSLIIALGKEKVAKRLKELS